MERLTPTPEQEQVIEHILDAGVRSGGAVVGSEVGSGKTLVAEEVGIRMWAERVLIIAPNSTFDNWEDTLVAQSGQQLRPCATKKLRGHSVKECKQNLADVLAGEPGWFFIGREMFASVDWETKVVRGENKRVQKRVWQKYAFDYAVYDESQMVSNPKGRGAKSWLAVQATLKLAQSADWFGNQIQNMHTIARSVWPTETHVEPNFVTWRDRFLTTAFDPFTWDKKRVVGEKLSGEFVGTLPCYVRLDSPVGVMPVAEQRWVDVSPKQRKLYDQLEESNVVLVENNPLITELPMHIRIRSRQLTLGMFTVDEQGSVDFPDEGDSTKLDELMSLLSDYPDEKFLVFTDSQKFARVAALRLNKRGVKAEEWSGQVSDANRQKVKANFVNGDTRVIVGVIAALSEGVDSLQFASRNVVFLSRADNELQNRQAVGRLHRKGQKCSVRVWDILARDTFDSGQASTLMQRALANNAAKKVA